MVIQRSARGLAGGSFKVWLGQGEGLPNSWQILMINMARAYKTLDDAHWQRESRRDGLGHSREADRIGIEFSKRILSPGEIHGLNGLIPDEELNRIDARNLGTRLTGEGQKGSFRQRLALE